MHEYIISLIVLLLAIPVAYILARLTKEELKKRKKFFIGFIALFLITVLLSVLFRFENWQAVVFTCIFMAVLELGLIIFTRR